LFLRRGERSEERGEGGGEEERRRGGEEEKRRRGDEPQAFRTRCSASLSGSIESILSIPSM
jgi:hypothetical protein